MRPDAEVRARMEKLDEITQKAPRQYQRTAAGVMIVALRWALGGEDWMEKD